MCDDALALFGLALLLFPYFLATTSFYSRHDGDDYDEGSDCDTSGVECANTENFYCLQ